MRCVRTEICWGIVFHREKTGRSFSQLGFKSGDLVTGVNGIDLNDPANTMRLYQTMSYRQ